MTTKTLALTEFLNARIAEDEAAARAATGEHGWRVSLHHRGEVWADRDAAGWDAFLVASTERTRLNHGLSERAMDDAAHIVRWHPARVLAECKSKRQIIADLQDEKHVVVEDDGWYTCAAATEDVDGGECIDDTRRGGPCDCGRDQWAARRLRWLALPYADHPDWRDEWLP